VVLISLRSLSKSTIIDIVDDKDETSSPKEEDCDGIGTTPKAVVPTTITMTNADLRKELKEIIAIGTALAKLIHSIRLAGGCDSFSRMSSIKGAYEEGLGNLSQLVIWYTRYLDVGDCQEKRVDFLKEYKI